MKAITLPEPGGPDSLVLDEVPDPMPRPGEVVVEVVAAGVNRADVMQRQGHYAPPPGSSAYPGLEVSGRIGQLGEGVDGWSVGDEVCALLTGGGYAERVAVPAGQLLPLPAGVDLTTAGGSRQVVGEGRDAATARRVGGNDRDVKNQLVLSSRALRERAARWNEPAGDPLEEGGPPRAGAARLVVAGSPRGRAGWARLTGRVAAG